MTATDQPKPTEEATRSDSQESRLLREPLLHFLVLGAALFGLYAYLNNDEAAAVSDERQIVVTEGKIEHLAALFSRTWQRPATRQELEGLVNDYIREEAAYREGTAMGLDQNDTIIRRRIRQKLDFVVDDLASQLQPSDEDLQKYSEEHPEKFRVDSRLTFRQVFFDPEKNADDLSETVSDMVVRLREDPTVDAPQLGDRTLLEFRYETVSEREVASLFGKEFAKRLIELKPGIWAGPIESAYGVHVAIVDEMTPGTLPALSEIRGIVSREWEHARRKELTDKYYDGLIDKYEVVIEWPQSEAN